MKKYTWLVSIFMVFNFLNACTKNAGTPEARQNNPINEREMTAVKNWLNNKSASSSDRQMFNKLVSSLDWAGTDKSNYESEGELITIPISEELSVRKYASRLKTNTFTTNYLVILLDNAGTVKQGTIGQVTPLEQFDNTQASLLIGGILKHVQNI